ncbi:MAG: exosortase A [Burkholderiaceae bacterium]
MRDFDQRHIAVDPMPVTRPQGSSRRASWLLAGVGIAVALVSLAVCYRTTLHQMIEVWENSESFRHGFIVAPISLWLVWRQREVLKGLVPVPNLIGIALLIVLTACWALFELSGVNSLVQFSVVAMIPAVVLTFMGWPITRQIRFPLLFLFFMVPAGDGLIPILMSGTARAAIWALRASGIPVYQEGLNFTLPTGQWSVIEACSGLNYVIAALVLSVLFAHLNFRKLKRQIAFIVIALLVAVVANWMRAYLIVMIGHFSQMRFGVGHDHVVYGWVFFGLVMFIVFQMGYRWSDSLDDSNTNASASSFAPARDSAWREAPLATMAMLALTLAVGVGGQYGLAAARAVTPRTAMPEAIGELPAVSADELALMPHFDNALLRRFGTFDRPSATQFYVAYFARQWEGAEMISHTHWIVSLSDPRWRIAQRIRREVSDGSVRWQVEELHLKAGEQHRLLWHWYTIGGVETVGDYAAKALTAWSMLRGHGDHSTVNVVMTDPDVDSGNAENRLLSAARIVRQVSARITNE